MKTSIFWTLCITMSPLVSCLASFKAAILQFCINFFYDLRTRQRRQMQRIDHKNHNIYRMVKPSTSDNGIIFVSKSLKQKINKKRFGDASQDTGKYSEVWTIAKSSKVTSGPLFSPCREKKHIEVTLWPRISVEESP